MRLVTAIAVALAACSSASEDSPDSASTSPASIPIQQNDPAPTEGASDTTPAATAGAATTITSLTSTTMPPEPDPFVGTGKIDRALRSEDGALVVTLTGYEWGAGPCRGLHEARLIDPAALIVEVIETVGQSPDGMCEEIGFDHAITVTDGIEQIRPRWFTDRPTLPECGTDADYGIADQNANARACFQDAYNARTPVEIEVVNYSEEGETAHRVFRIVDAERLEVLEEFRPPVDGDVTTRSPWTWNTYECEAFAFLNEPSFEIDGRPLLDANGECALERTQL